jgi:hypothetical protein
MFMDCAHIEERLSEYVESSLSEKEMAEIRLHLNSCRNCSDLIDEMHSLVISCQNYPSLEIDLDLLENILLRTSGRPRTRSFREQFYQYLVQPLMTPRYAAGASLIVLFLALTITFVQPHLSSSVSSVSTLNLLSMVDRGMQQVYSKGLKAYDLKNEWLDELAFFKNNTINKMRFMLERLDVPVEGRKQRVEPVREKEPSSDDKNSGLLSWSACLESRSQTAGPRSKARS